MSQNRSKLIDLFVGNLSNAVLHRVLEKATDDEDIADKYVTEVKTSWEIAKKYREKINPLNNSLPKTDLKNIKAKITKRVKSELSLRISKGYKNINLDSVESFVDEALKELKVS